MADLREQLQQCFEGRVCLVGVGSVEYGDDGFGVRLVEEVDKAETRRPKAERRPNSEARGQPPENGCSDFGFRPSFDLRPSEFGFLCCVLIAGTSPERFSSGMMHHAFDHVIFLDAVEFGGAPGSVVLLDSNEMAARFPQVSTHRLSLGLLAKHIEANGHSKAWLLGAQPQSLRPGAALTPKVQATLELLVELLTDLCADKPRVAEQAPFGVQPLGCRGPQSTLKRELQTESEVTP